MSDTPHLEWDHEMFADETDAVHLVYVHGSIHRPFQAANEADIRAMKQKNARFLATGLKRCGVIVIGYSGWDDAIVEALAASEEFEHGLYWVDVRPNPLEKDVFGLRVPEILCKKNACYVQTKGAGHFMAQLFGRMVKGPPGLLTNPISQVRRLLTTINLEELEAVQTPGTWAAWKVPAAVSSSIAGEPTFKQAKNITLSGLENAEAAFLGRCKREPALQLRSSACMAFTLGKCAEAINWCNRGIALPDLAPDDRMGFLDLRANVFHCSEQLDLAITDWTEIIENRDTKEQRLAQALLNRGRALAQKGVLNPAIADFTRALEDIPKLPYEFRMECLYYRGAAWGDKGEGEKAVADLSFVVERANGADSYVAALSRRASVWQRMGRSDRAIEDYARITKSPWRLAAGQESDARFSRAALWVDKGDFDGAIGDYTHIIDTPMGAPLDLVVRALCNRGHAWGRKGHVPEALADFARVIEGRAGATKEQKAVALSSRAWLYYDHGDVQRCLADTEAALRFVPSLENAMYDLGLALLAVGRDEDAVAAYYHAAEQHPEFIETIGLRDLAEATNAWLPPEQAAPVIKLLTSAKKQPVHPTASFKQVG